jgi:hypothetical protein
MRHRAIRTVDGLKGSHTGIQRANVFLVAFFDPNGNEYYPWSIRQKPTCFAEENQLCSIWTFLD